MTIAVSDVDSLDKSQMVYTSVLACDEKWQGFGNLLSQVWRERGVGDFWGHCLVAEGSAEVMLDPIVNVWDVAALHLLISESGGLMTDIAGHSTYTAGYAITSNRNVHQAILSFISPV